MALSTAAAAVRAALDPYVDRGHLPGYVAGWRRDGTTLICAGGNQALATDTRAPNDEKPMTEETIFRIASLSKPVGPVLTLTLVEEGTLSLDDQVARWLPGLADPRVLRRIDAPLDDTVPTKRPIVVADLLRMTAGFGLVLDRSPLRQAMADADLIPDPFPPPFGHDEFMARLGALPLALQPGEGWLYHTPADALAVLLARATGQSLSDPLRERIAEPLGMSDTALHAPDPGRRTTAYIPRSEGLEVLDPPDGVYSRPPDFKALGSGLVSTIPDYLEFLPCSLTAVGRY